MTTVNAALLGGAVEWLGMVAVAGLVGAALLLRAARPRTWCMLGALTLTPILLVAHIWDEPALASLRDRPLVLVVAALLGIAVVVAGAWLLVRHPTWLPYLIVVALPFRVPIESGGETANLLVPLYLVIGAAVLAFAWPRLRGADPDLAAEESGGRAPERRPGALEQLLAGVLVLYALQAAWSSDMDAALEQLVFFYVPFALLFVLLSRVEWSVRVASRCLAVLVGLAVVFAAVGAFEFATHRILLASNAVDANQYEAYFRVSSLFFDPNIFGRFLAVVMVLVAAAVLWTRDQRVAWAGGAALLAMLAGLVLTLSQSSIAMLAVGLAVLAALRWGWRPVASVVGVVALIAAVALLALPRSVTGVDVFSQRSIDKVTSGRFDLVRGGVDLFAERPILGWGSGAFSDQFRRQEQASRRKATSASHTIPVTVAAEQGLAGLLAYLALLVFAFRRLLTRAGLWMRRAGVGAAFVALVFHTLLYAAFLEDPLTWALLGVGVALAWRTAPTARERALARAESRAESRVIRTDSGDAPEPAATSFVADPA